MKKTFFTLIAIITVTLMANGQDPGFGYYQDNGIRTLTGRNRQGGGGYVSLTTGFSIIDNKHAVLFGGRISYISNKTMGIGIGGTGFINELQYEPALGRDIFLVGGYGGIYVEPILWPRSPIHLSFPVLFGAGGISYVSEDGDFGGKLIEGYDPFLLVEPSAEIEMNVSRFFRLAFGASYRYPTYINVGTSGTGIKPSSIKGWSYNLTFKFGKF